MTTEVSHGSSDRGEKTVSFIIDGESYETDQREWTPNDLMRQFAEKDPGVFYLVEIHGNTTKSYKDSGSDPIKIQPHDRFQTINIGPMPVSDGRPATGVQAFMAGLVALGFSSSNSKWPFGF